MPRASYWFMTLYGTSSCDHKGRREIKSDRHKDEWTQLKQNDSVCIIFEILAAGSACRSLLTHHLSAALHL